MLASLGLFAGVASFFVSKKRLIVEYVLLALLIVTAATTFTMWAGKRNALLKLESVQTRLSIVEDVNEVQGKTITGLMELRNKDSIALERVLADFKQMAQNNSEAENRLEDLESKNEIVRDYLNSPVPLDLQCVLTPGCKTEADSSNRNN